MATGTLGMKSGRMFITFNTSRRLYSLKQLHVNHGEGFVIQVEICPPGNRHPKVFAKTARDSDPASRLAVKVTGKLDNGQSFEKYLVQGPRFWKGP